MFNQVSLLAFACVDIIIHTIESHLEGFALTASMVEQQGRAHFWDLFLPTSGLRLPHHSEIETFLQPAMQITAQ